MNHQLVIDPKTNKYSRSWHTSHREITLKLNSLYLGETDAPHTVQSGIKQLIDE